MKPNQSAYSVNSNNPIWYMDPLGDLESTHTDEKGKVVDVKEDGDKGVYKHKGKEADALKEIAQKYSKYNPSAGGGKMGETEFIDEFVGVKSKKPEGFIIYSDDPKQSWDVLVKWGYNKSLNQDLSITKSESVGYGVLDLKRNKDWTINTVKGGIDPVMTGRKLNGYYATARSAGNYLAGLNGVTGTFQGVRISGTTYMKLAGALQVKKMNSANVILILTLGASFGPAPYYGEETYSGRRIQQGIEAGEKILKAKGGN